MKSNHRFTFKWNKCRSYRLLEEGQYFYILKSGSETLDLRLKSQQMLNRVGQNFRGSQLFSSVVGLDKSFPPGQKKKKWTRQNKKAEGFSDATGERNWSAVLVMFDSMILLNMMGCRMTDRDDLGSLDRLFHMHWGRLWPNTKTATITY